MLVSFCMYVTSRDSCYPIGCQILHVLAILYSSLQWTDLWIKSIVCLCLQDPFVAVQSHNVTMYTLCYQLWCLSIYNMSQSAFRVHITASDMPTHGIFGGLGLPTIAQQHENFCECTLNNIITNHKLRKPLPPIFSICYDLRHTRTFMTLHCKTDLLLLDLHVVVMQISPSQLSCWTILW